jgi:hypothetical protein
MDSVFIDELTQHFINGVINAKNNNGCIYYTFHTINKINDVNVIVNLELCKLGNAYYFQLLIQSKSVWQIIKKNTKDTTNHDNKILAYASKITDINIDHNWINNIDNDENFDFYENEKNNYYRRHILFRKVFSDTFSKHAIIKKVNTENIKNILIEIMNFIKELLKLNYDPLLNKFNNITPIQLTERDVFLETDKCSVCLNKTFLKTTCEHYLCLKCKDNASISSCPICRTELDAFLVYDSNFIKYDVSKN